MIVEPDEFVSARDASRSLGQLIDRLDNKELAKAVIVDRNRPRAVLVSVEEWERLMLWVPLPGTEQQGALRG